MKHNQLGDSDLRVSEICLGTMTWGEQNSEAEAHEQLDYAITQGINFIDTAEMYPVPPCAETACRTEQYIGTWLKHQPRDNLIVASKIAGPGRRDWLRGGHTAISRENIIEALHGSLARLQTDYLDIYQIHWPDRNVQSFGATRFDPGRETETVPILEQIETTAELMKAGKIRYYGLSNETSGGCAGSAGWRASTDSRDRFQSRISTTSRAGNLIWISPRRLIAKTFRCSPTVRSPAGC